MSKKTTLAISMSTALAAGLMAASAANADANPFGMTDVSGSFQVADGHEGKCGEGKCGASTEGKCGEGKCGTTTEGKCGEGKCGTAK